MGGSPFLACGGSEHGESLGLGWSPAVRVGALRCLRPLGGALPVEDALALYELRVRLAPLAEEARPAQPTTRRGTTSATTMAGEPRSRVDAR